MTRAGTRAGTRTGTLTSAWLRLELRRRWRSLVVLALLIALASGTVLASVAGARRGDSAGHRLLAQTSPSTATVLPNEPKFDWDAIRALPEVEAVATFAVTYLVTIEDGGPSEAMHFPLGDREAMWTIERPVLLEGRLANPRRADEVVVSAVFAANHRGVGETLTYRLPTPEQSDSSATGADVKPAGPRVRARIVGVVRSPWFSDQAGSTGGVVPSAGMFAKYRTNILGTKENVPLNALVRLKGGEFALPEFRADLTRVTGRSDIDIWNNAEAARHAQQVNEFESASLLAFGLAALVAAVVLVGQSVARYAATTAADLQVLRAVGMTSRQAALTASVAPTLAALAGATLGVGGAVAASSWMPIGAASLVEPSPGVDADWAVLAIGWVGVPLAVFAAAALAAWAALATRSQVTPRRSAVALAVARAGLPVPVVLGSRFALEPGRGRTAVPVRPALVGAVGGVLGVLAAFTFSAGIADASTHPERYGQTYQMTAFFGFNGEDFAPARPAMKAMAGDEDVDAVNDTRIAVAESPNASVTMFSHSSVGGRSLPVVLTDGTLPKAAGEVALAPTSADKLGAEVGSVVRLTGNRGVQRFRVAGIGFVPSGPHNAYDEGGWLTAAGYDRMFTGFKYHVAALSLRPGADAEAVLPRLDELVVAAGGEPGLVEVAEPPSQLAELRGVRMFPVVLAGFLALLAVGAVGHALATAVRRRRHEMAVLRALGMTRRQSRLVVVTQASLLAMVGVVFGIPLGVALGRTLWRLVSETTPLYYQPPVAVLALMLVVPVALAVANLLAAWPGRRAARLRVGQILRAE